MWVDAIAERIGSRGVIATRLGVMRGETREADRVDRDAGTS